jgi:hypothetical protein
VIDDLAMSSPSFNDLEVKTSVAAGAWLVCESMDNLCVSVGGTFVATVQVQVTVKGDTDPVNVGAAMTAGGQVQIPGRAKKVRINTTAFTSGAPWAVLAGAN